MASSNNDMNKTNDYLTWDAENFKALITRKLSTNPLFTDQIFQDSNLSTLIDVFSYMYEALSFYTNNAASEAMFTDSTIYENMNRLVKLLGYNPNGYNNPNVELLFSNTDPNGFIDISSLPIQFVLPKYTSFKTDKTDNRGQSVYYSLVNVFFLERNGNFIASDEKVKTINGKWKVYVTPLKSTGIPFESFELSDLTLDNSDINTVNYISHPYVDVYIKRIVNNTIAYLPFKAVSEGTLFNDSNTIYGPTSNVFELRINERKKYNLTFGDGLHGSRLQNNDELVVVYLEGNGSGSELSTNILNITGNNILVLSVDGLLPSEVAKLLQVDESDFTQFNDIVKSQIKITNPTASTTFTSMESVDDIRKNAPSWFRMGQNLITAKDYEQYIKGKYREDIYDCHVMNNGEYTTQFYKWLYDIRDCQSPNGNRLKVDIKLESYPYVDACDFNNVYIWTKFKGDITDTTFITDDLSVRKVTTAEPIIVSALDVSFVPCLSGAFGNTNSCIICENGYDYRTKDKITGDLVGWDPNVENVIEIVKDSNSIITPEKIKNNIINVMRKFFDPAKHTIGGNVDFNKLQSDMLAVGGVKGIRTVYTPTGTNTRMVFNGLSFASWTEKLATGEDKQIVKGNIQVKAFQFPKLVDDLSLKLEKRIKIVFESFNSTRIDF